MAYVVQMLALPYLPLFFFVLCSLGFALFSGLVLIVVVFLSFFCLVGMSISVVFCTSPACVLRYNHRCAVVMTSTIIMMICYYTYNYDNLACYYYD